MSLHSRSPRTPFAVLTATAGLAAAALVAGCGSSGSAPSALAPTGAVSAPATSADAPATGSGDSASAAAPGSGGPVLGGPALQSTLGAVKVASGFSVDKSSLDASGATPTTPGDYIGLQGCSDLTNAGADTLTSDHEASYAEYDLQNSADLSVTVVLADFYPGDADKQMAEVSALVAKCSSYQAKDTGGASVTVKVTAQSVPGLGDQAMDIHLGASTSGYVSDEHLLVRAGNEIVAMDQDDAAGASPADLSTLIKPYLAALG